MKPLRMSVLFVVFVLSVVGGMAGVEWFQNLQFAQAQQQVETTREQLKKVEDLATVFREVGKAVEPSVVSIEVRKTVQGAGGGLPPMDEDLLRRFFPDRDGDGEPDLPPGFSPGPGGPGAPFEQQGLGSGVIMEAQNGTAYIVTNNHVAGGATELLITLHDGREISNGTVVGTDANTDMAVIKIEADRLIPAKWGNSDELQKGDWVMAFGSPFGYVGSMTHGIVSALNRQAGILGRYGYENFIQTDAPINPGNSGGPLTNIRGEVVGINTAIASRSGGFQGIGFAIPSNQAKFVYESLKEKGKVTRGWLGVSISDVSRDLPKAQSFGYEGDDGVLIEQTFPNTPASGKLEPGDIIVGANDKEVENVQELRNLVAATAPGTEIKFKVFREGKTTDVALTIGEQPEDMSMASRGGTPTPPTVGSAAEKLGMTLTTVTDQLAEQFGLVERSEGALVTEVKPNSLAAKAGLRRGDLITRVGGKTVANAQEALAEIEKADVKAGIRFYVSGREGSRFVFIQEK